MLSNVYLDKLDKELESRGLCFVRNADDCNIFVKSEMAANRVMKSVTSWLERKLRLSESGNTQAMEEADAYISKPSETEPNHRMWIHPRRNLQGCEQQTRKVQKKRNVCGEFCNQSRDTWTQNKEPTRIGRPVAILFE